MQQVLKDAFEKSEHASAQMILAVAIALIKKGVLSSDDILAEYRPPPFHGMAPSAQVELDFKSKIRTSKKE